MTRSERDMATSELLKQLGWLSINQLAFYHKVIQIQKIKESKLPENLYKMYDWKYVYPTRQESKGLIKPIGTPRLSISQNTFKWTAANYYNSLPQTITSIKEMSNFKRDLKTWVMSNVPVK